MNRFKNAPDAAKFKRDTGKGRDLMKLSEQVAILEKENERLQGLVDTLGEELEAAKRTIAKQDRFIDLVSPSVARLEDLYDRITQDMVEIVDVYRAIRPQKND
jgi:archaellum component FlaC